MTIQDELYILSQVMPDLDIPHSKWLPWEILTLLASARQDYEKLYN